MEPIEPLTIVPPAINWRKVNLFILITYLISWIIAGILYLTGFRYGTLPTIIVVAALYMPAPAIATLIVQKFIYHAPLRPYGLRLRGIALLPLLLSILFIWGIILGTFAISSLAGNLLTLPGFGTVDFSDATFQQLRQATAQQAGTTESPIPDMPPLGFLFAALINGTLIGGVLNLPFTFGEEFGWRGLFLKEIQSLGFFRSNMLIGITWGLWHAPLIMQGHNYPDYPIAGIFMMIAFTTALSFPFAYVRLKSRTILAPSLMHAVLNGIAGITGIFITGANAMIGSVVGVAGILASLAITLGIMVFDRAFVRDYRTLE